MTATSNFPFLLRAVDLIPASASAETAQNAEPSIGVDPIDPTQIWAASFGAPNPFFVSNNGGVTWSIVGAFQHSDTTIAWKVDGSAVLFATLMATPPDPGTGPDAAPIETFPGVGPAINIWFGPPPQSINNDQPWIRTGPNDHVYVAFTNFDNALPAGNGGTASILVSDDGGNIYRAVTLDRPGAPAGQDSPAVRVAVNGNTAYAAFIRWNNVVDSDADGTRFNAQVMVVRSDNGGGDNFTAIGPGGNGVPVATPIDVFSTVRPVPVINTPLTLGQNRTGSNLAIAVDPNNSQHVLVAYNDAPGATRGQLQLVVSESFNGGGTWLEKFRTSSTTRSAQPAVAILANGAIGFLYNNYVPGGPNPDANGTLSQHFVTTTDDFATNRDVTLATASNAIPANQGQPYLGDYVDLTGIGNTFYGVFSASNADNGINASLTDVSFNRRFTGTPGTSSFQLTDGNGNPVDPSIDPFFFSYSIQNPAAPPAVSANMVLRNSGNGQYQIYNLGNNSILASYWLTQVATDWSFVTLGGFNDGNSSDMLLRNSTSGAFQVYNIAPNSNNITGSTSLGTVGLEWQVLAFGNFDNVGNTDMILRNVNTAALQVYNITNNQVTGSKPLGAVGLDWQFSGVGDFSSRPGESDMILRNIGTGGLQVYNIANNQITGTDFMGTVGLEWQFSGVGDFSSRPGESDMILRNVDTGGLQVYNIANNQITGSAFLGTVGVDWTFAGIAPISSPGESDLVLRNDISGAFQVYNIADNQITGSAPLGTVGTEWQLGGFAPSSPTGATGSPDGSTAQLVQAMAGFGGSSGAGESLNTAPLSADTSQQTLLTTPQHA
jgi:hypothetical protein